MNDEMKMALVLRRPENKEIAQRIAEIQYQRQKFKDFFTITTERLSRMYAEAQFERLGNEITKLETQACRNTLEAMGIDYEETESS